MVLIQRLLPRKEELAQEQWSFLFICCFEKKKKEEEKLYIMVFHFFFVFTTQPFFTVKMKIMVFNPFTTNLFTRPNVMQQPLPMEQRLFQSNDEKLFSAPDLDFLVPLAASRSLLIVFPTDRLGSGIFQRILQAST